MRRLLSASRLCALVFTILMIPTAAALAADRSITLLPGTDMPGFDYAVERGVTLRACATACENDVPCRAFTFNERAGWCFFKSEAGPQTPFAGATSGRVALSPTPEELLDARQQDLPFPAHGMVHGAVSFASALPQTDPAPGGSATSTSSSPATRRWPSPTP